MTAGTRATAEIAARFGSDVLRDDGSVDRALLANTVFEHPEDLRALEAIVHPPVRSIIRERIGREVDKGVVILDAVKLLQSDLLELVDAVWVVLCDPDTQMRRLTELRGMSVAAAQSRVRAQPSFDDPRVTRIVSNSGSFSQLKQAVEAGWFEFLGPRAAASHRYQEKHRPE